MKIFWSWQSDTPQRTGRHLIRAALERAAEVLADHPDLEPAERPEVDSDTANVPGSPAIAATILDKITRCAVFVADVTPVATTSGGKRVPNPNVMIELGYAVALVKNERIVLVMNQREEAKVATLPFDLRHWRAPLIYSLARDADDNAFQERLMQLTEGLVERLGASLTYAAQQAAAPLATPLVVAPQDGDPAIWTGAYPAITAMNSSQNFSIPVRDGPKMFCRIIPRRGFEATRADMQRTSDNRLPLRPLGQYQNLWNGANSAGAIGWSQDFDGRLLAATQWFQETGEIWGVWPDALTEWRGHMTFTSDHNARALEDFLENHFFTLERFGAEKPWRVVVGAYGLSDTVLPGNYRGGWRGLADQVVHEQDRVRGSGEDVRSISYAFVRKVYDAYGAPNLSRASYETMLGRKP